MTNIAFISDPHLTHAYHFRYNKLADFQRLVKDVLQQNPDAIIVLGDFFDKKATDQGRPLSHIEGSRQHFPLVDLIQKTEIPWYLLTGNHDDIHILRSIAQSASNCYYCATNPEKIISGRTLLEDEKPIILDNIVFWFGDIDYRLKNERKKELFQQFRQAKNKYVPGHNKKSIILTHLDLIPRGKGVGVEKEILGLIVEAFDLVINGHEHSFLTKIQGYSKCKNIPAALPWWIAKGRGIVQKFSWTDKKLTPSVKLISPFGYVMFDTKNFSLSKKNFHSFLPSVVSIEVNYDVSDCTLDTIDKDWNLIAKTITEKIVSSYSEIHDVIIIPVFTGDMGNFMAFDFNNKLDEISNKFNHIFIAEFREGDGLKTHSFSVDELHDVSFTNAEGVFQKTLEDVGIIVDHLKEKKIDVSESQIINMISQIQNSQHRFFQKQERDPIYSYLGKIIETLQEPLEELVNRSIPPTEVSNMFRKTAKLVKKGKITQGRAENVDKA